MSGKSDFAEFLFPDFPPDPLKKKAPARRFNADAGVGSQDCSGKLPLKGRQLKTKASEQTRTNQKQETVATADEFDFFGEKSPLSGGVCEKASSVVGEKASSVSEEKASSDYLPVVLSGVVDEAGLRALLNRAKQHEWASRKRIAGLLMLIDYFARNAPCTTKKPGVAMSSELSRKYVSSLKRAKSSTTIPQPLPLLVKIGILGIAQPAIVAPHRKESARYWLHPNHGKPKKIEVILAAQQRDKLRNAGRRNEERLNRKHSFRRRLLVDLAAVGLSADGRNLALTMMTKGEKESSIKLLMSFVDGNRRQEISIDPCGTIHTFARLAPRELKPHLTLHTRPVTICDIKSAHMCVLSCVVQERVDWLAKRGQKTGHLEQERRSFITLLESSDIYGQLAEGGDRSSFKKSLLSSINMPTSKAIHLHGYVRFRRAFPRIVGVVEDIKKKGHHGISRPLQHHTANIIRLALLELQQKGIPAIPDTDALIVPSCHETTVMQVINRALFQVTGVRRT